MGPPVPGRAHVVSLAWGEIAGGQLRRTFAFYAAFRSAPAPPIAQMIARGLVFGVQSSAGRRRDRRLARRTARASTLDELLFAMIVLGDDRVVERTVISQAF